MRRSRASSGIASAWTSPAWRCLRMASAGSWRRPGRARSRQLRQLRLDLLPLGHELFDAAQELLALDVELLDFRARRRLEEARLAVERFDLLQPRLGPLEIRGEPLA